MDSVRLLPQSSFLQIGCPASLVCSVSTCVCISLGGEGVGRERWLMDLNMFLRKEIVAKVSRLVYMTGVQVSGRPTCPLAVLMVQSSNTR